MADRKISDLTALTTPASGDYLPIVDISETAASSKNKRITIEELFRGVPLGTAAAPSIAIEGDEDTGIYSPGANQVAISTNGTERVEFGTSEVVFNDGGANYDFRIEGDTNSSLFFVDASADRVGVGTTSPVEQLHVSGSSAINARFESSGTTASIRFANSTASDGYIGYTNQNLTFTAANAERARIDSSGRLLVGTSTARDNIYGFTSGIANRFQIEGTGYSDSAMIIVRNSNDGNFGGIVIGKTRGTSVNSNTIVQNNDDLGQISFQGADGQKLVSAAEITAEVDGTPGANDMPGRLVFSTTADAAATPTERLRITSAGVLQVADAGDITVGTTTGTKIGTGTTQKLGFWNATPVVQPAAVADATDAATVITQLNDLLAKLRTLGIIAT